MAAIDLDELMRAAGASLGEAQGQLLEGVAQAPTVMAIAEATLEMKLTVEGARGKGLAVAAVNASLARSGAVNPAALSSVSMRFVALGDRVASDIDTPGLSSARPPAAPVEPPGVKPGGPGAVRPQDLPPGVADAVKPRPPFTRAEMRDVMLGLPDVAPLRRAGAEVRVDLVTLADGQTLARAIAPDGRTLAARVMMGKG